PRCRSRAATRSPPAPRGIRYMPRRRPATRVIFPARLSARRSSVWNSSEVSPHLDVTLLLFGALLVVGALVSRLARRSLVSMTALFVLAGFVLGQGGVGVLHFHARSSFV